MAGKAKTIGLSGACLPGGHGRGLATAGLAFALTLALAGAPALAWADEPSLEDLQNAAIEAGEAYQQAQDKVDDLKAQEDEAAARVADLEAQLPAQREKAEAAIRQHYKYTQGQADVVLALLASDSLSDFISQSTYLSAIVTSNLDAVQQLNDTKAQLEQEQATLEQARSQAEQEAQVAKAAWDDAQQKQAAAEAQAKANEAAAQAAYEASVASGNADAATNQAISSASSSSSSGDYSYVAASMYGEGDGFMYGTTASGATVTPTSMGVAMKKMPLGTVIEISYNGRTVRAVVNDRGPYVGNRQIDLQPAVAHALGFNGVGTVGYRVVS